VAGAATRQRPLQLEDLDEDQLRWKPAPTANSLEVIVVHLGYAERLWIRAIFAAEEMDMGWRDRMFDELLRGWSTADVIAFHARRPPRPTAC
jgi:uncharacterized damage-inducible protein DinB